MFASTLALARHAGENGYAIPAVNVFDDLSMRAVVAAATETSAPLIVQISVKTVRSLGAGFLTGMFQNAIKDTNVPVALHLDHCPDRTVIDEIIAQGWSSVLFDASDRDLATAERETAEVVHSAHAAGVEVESEIENIIGVEDGVGSDKALHAYDAQTLARVGEETGVDLLAPQLGTAHGQYHAQPVLLPERVRELTALCDIPVVLHGGTGLSPAEFRSFINAGVTKINISTAVKMSYMHSAAEHLARAKEKNKWDPPSMFQEMTQAIQGVIAGHIRTFGADGHAASALSATKER